MDDPSPAILTGPVPQHDGGRYGSFAIDALRPTQMTLGYDLVARKRRRWRSYNGAQRRVTLRAHPLQVVIDPDGAPWMIDRHHLVRALHEEGVARIPARILRLPRRMAGMPFPYALQALGWLHPFDAGGRLRTPDELPHHIGALVDDPYRSLAGRLRDAGGYTKAGAPFAEFRWADFLRCHLPPERLAADPQAALREALWLARSPAAADLPGWRGETAPDAYYSLQIAAAS